MKSFLLLAFFVLNFNLCAQNIQISSCELEFSKDSIKTAKKKYYPTKEILLNAKNNFLYRYRIVINLKNATGEVAEGIVYRYSISAKFKKKGRTEEGVWSIPFFIDEIRISKLLAGAEKKIYIFDLNLQESLNRIKASDFEIESLKIEIMKEPKKGDERIEIFTNYFPLKKI